MQIANRDIRYGRLGVESDDEEEAALVSGEDEAMDIELQAAAHFHQRPSIASDAADTQPAVC